MEVQILVTAQISFDDDTPDFEPGDPGEERMRESVREAVENALSMAEGAGFNHDMAGIASVGVVDCEVFTATEKQVDLASFIKELPDPDTVLSSEYRAVYELLEDCEDLEQAQGMCEELQYVVTRTLNKINNVLA